MLDKISKRGKSSNCVLTVTTCEVTHKFRISKSNPRKVVFAKIREWINEVSSTNNQHICQHCGKKYAGVNTHNFLCGECCAKAAKINREGVGHIEELSFTEALRSIPEGVDPIKFEQEIDAQIRTERQALIDLWKKDDQAWNLYCDGKRLGGNQNAQRFTKFKF